MQLLSKIEELIQEYNTRFPNNKCILLKDQVDVRKMFICAYDEIGLGLFRKLTGAKLIGSKKNNKYDIYFGENTSMIGIKKGDTWLPNGAIVRYSLLDENYNEKVVTKVASCDMKDSISVDDVRQLMMQYGALDTFIPGTIEQTEICKVLQFAREIYYTEEISL